MIPNKNDSSSSSDHKVRLLSAAEGVIENRTSIFFQRDIVLLALCWALTLTTSTLLTSVGPLSAKDLGAGDDVSPFTIGTFLLGAAVSSYPSGKIFRKFGRYKGFSMGCLAQVFGSISGLVAMSSRNIALLYIGCFFIGLGQGIGQFYRFSAVEVALEQYKSEAVSLVLTGGVISAFLGPGLGVIGVDLFPQKYAGSFLMMGIIGILNQYTVYFVNFPDEFMKNKNDEYKSKTISHDSDVNNINEGETYNIMIKNNDTGSVTKVRPSELSVSSVAPSFKHEEIDVQMKNNSPPREVSEQQKRRPMREIITQRNFIVACLVATLAHTVMIMIMSNCTLAMDDDYSVLMQTFVMQSHFAGMFLPGFITGIYIKKFGTFTMSIIGGVLFAFSAVSFLQDDNAENYFIGMILLGVAWNFSFSAGTVMLTYTYSPMGAPDVQAINDLILFSIASAGSLASGFIYAAYGWQTLIFCVSGMMGLNLMLLVANAIFNNEDTEGDDDLDGVTLGSLMKQSDDFSSYSEASISRYSILSRDSDDEYSHDGQRESFNNTLWNEHVRRVSFA